MNASDKRNIIWRKKSVLVETHLAYDSPKEDQNSHEESLEVAVSVDVCVVINGHFPKHLGG